MRSQRVVVEFNGGDWWIMHDTGDVEVVGTPEQALKRIQKLATRGNKTVTITNIEWRNTPEGFEAPKGAQ